MVIHTYISRFIYNLRTFLLNKYPEIYHLLMLFNFQNYLARQGYYCYIYLMEERTQESKVDWLIQSQVASKQKIQLYTCLLREDSTHAVSYRALYKAVSHHFCLLLFHLSQQFNISEVGPHLPVNAILTIPVSQIEA